LFLGPLGGVLLLFGLFRSGAACVVLAIATITADRLFGLGFGILLKFGALRWDPEMGSDQTLWPFSDAAALNMAAGSAGYLGMGALRSRDAD